MMKNKRLLYNLFFLLLYTITAKSQVVDSTYINNYFKDFKTNKDSFEDDYKNTYLQHKQKSIGEYSDFLKEINSIYADVFKELRKYETIIEKDNCLFVINFERGEVEVVSSIDSSLTLTNTELASLISDNITKLNEILTTKISSKEFVNLLDDQVGGLKEIKNISKSIEKNIVFSINSSNARGEKVLKYKYTLLPDHLKLRSQKFYSLITKYSEINKIDKNLVMAIIHVESCFNPYAMSSAKACGLMQIVPKMAGVDVANFYNEPVPSYSFLFVPENNIRYGCKYLSILKNIFSGIDDETKKMYCVIASYNGGSSPIIKIFGGDKKNAIININNMPTDLVYNFIIKKHPYFETRNYLEKVIYHKKEYDSLK